MTNEKFHELKTKVSFIRLSTNEIRFHYVKSNPKARRHQRGSFVFKVTLKQMMDGDFVKYPAEVFFQPDSSGLYLHNIFKKDAFLTDKEYSTTKEMIIDAGEKNGRIHNSNLLLNGSLEKIKKALIYAVNAKEYWTLDRQGNAFYQVQDGVSKIGRFTFNFSSK